jgi:hypothetical protein
VGSPEIGTDDTQRNKFSEVYKNAQTALGKDIHSQMKITLNEIVSEKEAHLRESFRRTEKELSLIQEGITDPVVTISTKDRESIQLKINNIVNQLRCLSKDWEGLLKHENRG